MGDDSPNRVVPSWDRYLVKAEPPPEDQLLRNASRAGYWAWGRGANQRRGCSLGNDLDRNITRGRKKT